MSAKAKKTLKAVVLQDSLNQTVKVRVNLIKINSLYQKRYVTSRQYLVHTEEPIKKGDQVLIQECRPLSKRKSWKIVPSKGKK